MVILVWLTYIIANEFMHIITKLWLYFLNGAWACFDFVWKGHGFKAMIYIKTIWIITLD